MSSDNPTKNQRQGVYAHCPHGGPAPCVDDLCHSSDMTLCGLERYYDFCDHGFIPESCPTCDEDEYGLDYEEDYDAVL